MKSIFRGVCPALVTPFKNNDIDIESLKVLIQKQLNENADAICILGTTGEASTITDSERKKIITTTIKCVDKKCKVIVGCGTNDFEKTKRYILQAKKLGANAALVVTPYYNKTTQNGLYNYYQKLCEIGLPIIAYNVPSRTGMNIDFVTLKKLSKLKNIFGIKESSSDINRIINVCKICSGKMPVYSGEDNLNYIFYMLGASGCISVTANLYCKKVKEIFDLVSKQKIKKAVKLQFNLDRVNESLFLETNPIPIKALLAEKGYIKNELRLPLEKMSKGSKKIMLKNIKKYEEKMR